MVVHRLLAASLDLEPLQECYEDKSKMHALAGNMNTRHYMAQMAGRASVELHTLLYVQLTVRHDAQFAFDFISYHICAGRHGSSLPAMSDDQIVLSVILF